MKKHPDIYDLIYKVYNGNEGILDFLIPHLECVAKLAVKIAKNNPSADSDFVERAALLHDIGILKTYAPKIKCFGDEPYIRHGVIGKKILEEHGFLREAVVAMTHVGVGLTAAQIKENNLPLEAIDMIPTTQEEQIVAYADLFYSKDPKHFTTPKTVKEVRQAVKKYGDSATDIFDNWHKKFG